MVLMLRVVKSEVTATVSDMANSKKAQTQSLKTPAEVQSSIATHNFFFCQIMSI